MRCGVIVCLAACGGVDLTAEAPSFTSSTLSRTAANPFTARFHIEGDLPGDAADIYLTIEKKLPGAASFVFEQNAQIERAKALLEEPVTYDFRVNSGPAGVYEFRAIVDAGGLIDESDENNNISPVTQITSP